MSELLEGDWGSRYFVNVAQAGVGAAAAQTAVEDPPWLGTGPLSDRLLGSTAPIPTDRHHPDHGEEGRRVRGIGGHLRQRPVLRRRLERRPEGDSGRRVFSTSRSSMCKKRQAPALVPKVVKGTHLREPGVRRLSASEFTLATESVWPVEADGDLIGNTTVTGRVIPAAMRLKI